MKSAFLKSKKYVFGDELGGCNGSVIKSVAYFWQINMKNDDKYQHIVA